MSEIEEFATTLNDLLVEFKTKIRAEGEDIVKNAFSTLFDKYPTLEAIRWEQYTPYFNDGDPCEFSVGEPRFKVANGDEDEGDWGDGFISNMTYKKYVDLTPEEIALIDPKSSYRTGIFHDGVEIFPEVDYSKYIRNTNGGYGGYYEHTGRYYVNAPIPGFNGFDDEVNKIFNIPEDVFETIFGDHSRITVTRDSIEVDEYDHD